MDKPKLELCRHRDLDELITLTYEFIKQNIFQYGKYVLICALPFIACMAITGLFGFEVNIAKLLNIYEILQELKFETISFNPIANPANSIATAFYLFIISAVGSLTYAYLKSYIDNINIKKAKFKDLWFEGKEIFSWILLFNLIIFLTLSIYIFFLGLLSPFVSISYVLFIWSFTFQILSLTYFISAQIISWGTVYILFFVFILLPLLYLGFKLLLRFSLLLLYSIPLKLEEPNLNFTQRLVKCYQLLEEESFKAWMFIHLVSIVIFFIAYVFCMPFYGLLLNMGLFEFATIGLISITFFKYFSYGLVVFLSGFAHLAISLSFYSLYAKISEEAASKQNGSAKRGAGCEASNLTNPPL